MKDEHFHRLPAPVLETGIPSATHLDKDLKCIGRKCFKKVKSGFKTTDYPG